MTPSEKHLHEGACESGERIDLSPAGAARYEAMLGSLQDAVVRRGRVRRTRRRIVSGVGTVGVVALLFVVITMTQQAGTSRRVADSGSTPTADDSTPSPVAPATKPDSTKVAIEYVTTEPGALDRYRAADTVAVAKYTISDHKVVEILHDIGRPAGIIREGTEVRLTAAVTDDALRKPPPADWKPAPPHSSDVRLRGM